MVPGLFHTYWVRNVFIWAGSCFLGGEYVIRHVADTVKIDLIECHHTEMSCESFLQHLVLLMA